MTMAHLIIWMIPDLQALNLMTSSRGSQPTSQGLWAWRQRGGHTNRGIERQELGAGVAMRCVVFRALTQASRTGVKDWAFPAALG